jgi:hypothetical protein
LQIPATLENPVSDYAAQRVAEHSREKYTGCKQRGLLQIEVLTHWPKVLRRVAGYNLDIFDNQSERARIAGSTATVCAEVNG